MIAVDILYYCCFPIDGLYHFDDIVSLCLDIISNLFAGVNLLS